MLSAFAERRLPAPLATTIEAHLDGCADCLAMVAAIVHGAMPEAGAGSLPDEAGPGLGAGTRVGRYVILEMIGQGGMGTVYVAHDPQLDRRVALKVLRADRTTLPAERARLAREARTMARLAHPNIVTVYDAGEADGRFHIAMELVDGSTLRGWLAAAARSTGEILAVFRVAGRALSAAHAAGIVHRDFKPDNVLIDRGGRVVVTDFGIASSHDPAAPAADAEAASRGPAAPAAVTQTGAVLGTPRYMSPEQHAGARADARADQWSFAVALHEALYDALPFAGASLAELRAAIEARRIADPPDPPRRRVPPRVRAAILRALSLRPEDRFHSVDALLEALADPRGSRGRRLLAGASVAMALSLGAAALAARSRTAAVAPAPLPPASQTTAPPLDAGGKRPAVIVEKFENRSGDARLEGVVETVMVPVLDGSRRLDAFFGGQAAARIASLDAPAGLEGDDAIREIARREGRAAVVVHGELTREGQGVAIAVVATRLDTGAVVLADRAVAATDADLAPAAVDLAFRLRAALGDPQPEGAERPRFSASLDALHAWAEGGRLSYEGGDAEPAFRRALAADPGFGDAHAALGLVLFDNQETPEAARELALGLAGTPGMSQRRRLVLMAAEYAAEGRPSESIAASERLLALWPGDRATHRLVTSTALGALDWPLAVELARRAVADYPQGLTEHAALLVALLGAGEIDEAARTADRDLAQLSRLTPISYATAAMAFALRGERDRAIGLHDLLAKEDPELADEARADLALYEGRLDDAERLLQERIDEILRHGDAASARTEYRALARVKLRRGDLAGARAAGRSALGEADIADMELTVAVLAEAGDVGPARALARAASERKGALWRAYGKVAEGDVLLYAGNLRQARAAYEAAAGIQDVWQAHAQLGQLALREHRWQDAERELSSVFARRGEVAVTATPTLHLLPPIVEGLARARAALADGGARGR